MKKWLYFASLILILGFAVIKVIMWKPFFDLVVIKDYKSIVKISLTVLLANPFYLPSGETALKVIDGEKYIIDSNETKETKSLIKIFPPPSPVIDPNTEWHQKVSILRKFVFEILEQESDMPQIPEPVRAIDLLGLNNGGKKYPRLCSKNAKIFVQYLSGINIDSRIVQLYKHVTVEVWNPKVQKWELHDPYFNSTAMKDNEYLSSAEAFDLYANNDSFSYGAPHEIFQTVVYTPRTNFSNDQLPTWHYFSYENLHYWKTIRTSDISSALWKK
tara:strand:- start:160 stop:978 length:819 start_codon:yes stop_codon:yes gene_type:complete